LGARLEVRHGMLPIPGIIRFEHRINLCAQKSGSKKNNPKPTVHTAIMTRNELEIRPAQRADLTAILDLLAQDSMSETPEPSGPRAGHLAAFETMSAHPDHQIVVGTIEGRVVATLQLSFIPGLSHDGRWRAQIEGVRVHRDLRGSGIGTAMIEWVIARARERGCWRVELTSNQAREAAQRFYARLGFRATHVGMKLQL